MKPPEDPAATTTDRAGGGPFGGFGRKDGLRARVPAREGIFKCKRHAS